jgi:hypothetical protein
VIAFSLILKNGNVSYCDFATRGLRGLSQFWWVEWGNCGVNFVFHVPMFKNKTNIPINPRRRRSSVACREHYMAVDIGKWPFFTTLASIFSFSVHRSVIYPCVASKANDSLNIGG